jgi:hydrogenase maturation factor
MCLTVPKRVKEVRGDRALMQDGRWVSTKLVGGAGVGDMLLVQANLAIEKVDKKQTKAMKKIMLSEIEK